MLFSLKKIISFFIEPLGLVLCFFLLGLYFLIKKRPVLSKISLIFALLLLFTFSYPPVSNALISPLEAHYQRFNANQHPEVKFIHILGFGHNQDTAQPISSRLYDTSIKRITHGVLIYKQLNNPKVKLILTGSKPSNFKTSIAKMASNFAVKLGINPDNIILGGQAKDTSEEAKFAQSIVGKQTVILVSSASHLPRAMQLFQALGVNTIPAPTNFYKNTQVNYFSAPSLHSLKVSQIAIHEYWGKLWLKMLTVVGLN